MAVAAVNGNEHSSCSSTSSSTGDMRSIADDEPELHLVFADETHNSRMLTALNTMRKNRHFCDVTLHVGNAEVHAHRAVLASASPYLFEHFTKDQEQNQQANVVTFKLNGGFDKDALKILVDFAYTARLDVKYNQVKAVFLAANQLKMDRVTKICAQHLMKHLSADNCIEIRSLPGIARNRDFTQQVDAYIAAEFAKVCKSNSIVNLNCAKIEVLNQSREEMSLVNESSLSRLVLEWVRRQVSDSAITTDALTDKTFMLYLAIDNSLQDCSSLPSGDISDTEIVQDYKKLSLRNSSNPKSKRKFLSQPSKPRVLIYNREIGEELASEMEPDWSLIATEKLAEHSFIALVTLGGKLSRLSIQLRLNTPSTPSPVQTPDSSRPSSEEKPDLYCALAPMACQRCAVGCGNFLNTLIVCGGYDRTECLKSVEQYVPESNQWRQLPAMRESRGRFRVAILEDKVYAIGGSNGTTELDSVEMYDSVVGKWVKRPSLPLARSNMGVCAMDGLIYCVGGWNGQVGIKQCDVFDPKTLEWSSSAPLNTGRYQAGVASYNRQVYAIGGCDAWNCLSSVEAFDPAAGAWSPASPLITARRGCGVAVFGGRIYVVGGSDGTHSLDSTEVLEGGAWRVGPALTTPRANVELAVVGGRLYAVGGFSGKNFLNTIEYLDGRAEEWTTFVPGEAMVRRRPRSRRGSEEPAPVAGVESTF